MALKDQIPFGMSLPHRSPDPLDPGVTHRVAVRADQLGFSDLWVTENTLDHVHSYDPMLALTYAAAVTTRVRLGVSVVILPVHQPARLAHQTTTLDVLSGGRAILGVGLGWPEHFAWFATPPERRVRRFTEYLTVMKKLWTESKVSYRGELIQLEGAGIPLRPVQKPHPPVWLGGSHVDAITRAVRLGDGWMGAGGSSNAAFGRAVPLLRAALERVGRDPKGFAISKRVFLSVHDKPEVARAELDRWFSGVYKNPEGVDQCGVHGTSAQVKEQLAALAATGATHLLLNPVARHEEQLEVCAEIVGLRW
ncbi:MAG: LLM class flavin-dependent oxidoreductase [Alphaproteobacteria bacterium]|nr:LLM class flavin-dependent oxidoreductase [Alphaproteobacteria bacterium]